MSTPSLAPQLPGYSPLLHQAPNCADATDRRPATDIPTAARHASKSANVSRECCRAADGRIEADLWC